MDYKEGLLMEKMMTRQEFATLMRVDVKTVSRWAKDKLIPCIWYGRKLRIPESAAMPKEAVK